MKPDDDLGPQLLIEQIAADATRQPGCWSVGWRIENLGDRPVQILSGRLPHSRFRAPEQEFTSGPEISAPGSGRLDFKVSCNEAPGTAVDNAFLILRVLCCGALWRVLARLTVAINEAGEPWTATESVTKHRIGFSRASPQE